MESGSFQSQVLCVMEVLAKAAVAEINRRVDDSCAVLRLEVSQSRRDIDLLRRKCEVMEAELRRTRMRARRRGFAPPAAERQRTDWDGREDAEPRNQPADQDPADEAELMQIKEEHTEDDTWKNRHEDKLTSGPEEPSHFQLHQPDNVVDQYHSADKPTFDTEPVDFAADPYDRSPEQQVNRTQTEADFVVKLEKEEEPDENAAPLDLGHRLPTQEEDGQTWSHRDPVDPNFLCVGQEFGQISTVDTVPRIQSVGKPVVVGAAGMKRVRWFGSKRPQPDEEPSALSQVNSISPQQPQHQNRDSARHQEENPTAQSRAGSGFHGLGRASWGALRRTRTPWTSCIGEKRFDCTYCGRGFMRFSQLKEHQRSHTGEKPFSCALCGRSFTKQCNLIRHAVVHSGEKPHECALCGKCFTQRSSLKSHQKTAH